MDNKRELRNLLQRALMLVDSQLDTVKPMPSSQTTSYIGKTESWHDLAYIPGTPEYVQREEWNKQAQVPGSKDHHKWLALKAKNSPGGQVSEGGEK